MHGDNLGIKKWKTPTLETFLTPMEIKSCVEIKCKLLGAFNFPRVAGNHPSSCSVTKCDELEYSCALRLDTLQLTWYEISWIDE